VFSPEPFEQADGLRVEEADHPVHADHELRRTKRPTFLQQQVVNILQAQTGHLAEDVHGVQNFLQVDHADFKRLLLLLHHLAQGIGCRPVAAACVEID
jgi:hypothetical protein